MVQRRALYHGCPLGRRGRWQEFLSRYNIVVVYKPGTENDAADGMSRWAYPAGLADDMNFHGSDADLEKVTPWEASEREKEQQLIAANQYPRKILEVRTPKGRPSPQDMQECDYLLLQVNRLHSSVHYDSSSLPDDPAVDAVQSVSDHCEPCCPFPPCFSQVSMSLEEDSSSEAESSVGLDESICLGPEVSIHGNLILHTPIQESFVRSVRPVVGHPVLVQYFGLRRHFDPSEVPKEASGNPGRISFTVAQWGCIICLIRPQWSHPHIRRDGKICVPQSIVSQVIRAVHACAHGVPDASERGTKSDMALERPKSSET